MAHCHKLNVLLFTVTQSLIQLDTATECWMSPFFFLIRTDTKRLISRTCLMSHSWWWHSWTQPGCSALKPSALYNQPPFHYKRNIAKLSVPPPLKEVFGKVSLILKKDEGGTQEALACEKCYRWNIATPCATFGPPSTYLEMQDLRYSESEAAF